MFLSYHNEIWESKYIILVLGLFVEKMILMTFWYKYEAWLYFFNISYFNIGWLQNNNFLFRPHYR
jgi:hypothetical protein